jgi:hypothetical protein
LRWFKDVQELKVNFQVSRILETSKDSENKVEATQFDNIGEENADLQESLPLDAIPFGWQSWQ